MIHELPQGLRLRLLLVSIAVYRGAHPTPAGGTYSQWLWTLLNGPLGLILTELKAEVRAINGSQARQYLFSPHVETWMHVGMLLRALLCICVV